MLVSRAVVCGTLHIHCGKSMACAWFACVGMSFIGNQPCSGTAAEGETRTHFPAFPYDPPYAIQRDFMAAVYRRLQTGGVGLFESPTGMWPRLCASFN